MDSENIFYVVYVKNKNFKLFKSLEKAQIKVEKLLKKEKKSIYFKNNI